MRCCLKSLKVCAAGVGLGLALTLLIFVAGCGGESGLAVTLTPSANQAVDQGQSVSFTAFVPGDTSNSGVTWTLTGAHCKGPACGTFSNDTPFAATYQAPKTVTNNELLTVTLTATSVAENSAYATLNIVVSPAPVIETSTIPGMLNGSDYNEQIVANGGVAPLVFTVSSGSLPPGLNLNTNGYVTGRTTSDGGTYNFTVTVTDQGSPPLTTSQAYTVVVTPAPSLSVATTSLPAAARGTSYNFGLAANGGVPPLTWVITSGTLPPGMTFAGSTGQISGIPTTQGTFPFTVQVTDSSLLSPGPHSQTATQSLSLTVGPPNALSIVTSTLPQAQTASLYSQTIVTNGGVGPFTWALTSGILPSGISLNASAGTITGTATAVSTNTFTVQVTDSESPPVSASATFTLTVIAAINNSALLNGDYVFIFNGYNSSGPVVIGGGFVADGNGGLSGAVDSNNNDGPGTTNNNGPGPTAGNAMTGTYTIAANGQGTIRMTINSITFDYAFALDGDGNGQFIETDVANSPLTRGTGILRKQPTPLPTYLAADFIGNYAFQLAGIDSNNKRASYAGVLHADGIGNFSNGNVDTNDAGTVGTNITGAGGTFLVASNGRGQGAISIPGQATLNFIFYMITPSDILFMGFDELSANPMTTGEAILQTQPSFDAGSMNGSSVATTTGQDTSGKASVLLGLLATNGSSGATATLDTNDGGSFATTTVSGGYSVASNGRVTTSGLGNQVAVIYLISPNYGFVIGQDSAASSGVAEAQSSGPFAAGSFDSYFTLGPPFTGSPCSGDAGTDDFAGSFVSNGVSSLTGQVTEAAISGTTTLAPNLAVNGTYTVSANGGGSISFSSPVQLPSQFVFYILSPTAVRAIPTASAGGQPSVFFMNH